MDIVQVWRVTDEKYADSAFSGEGARQWGGRFNSPGTPAVYTSGSLSLALLEILVQTSDRSYLQKKVLLRADIPDRLIETPSRDDLPEQWNHVPTVRASQNYGDHWINDEFFPVLRVPSVVVPHEYNYVINPKHEQVTKISISDACPLPLDPRIFGGLEEN
jgi:RES domain-containing protein